MIAIVGDLTSKLILILGTQMLVFWQHILCELKYLLDCYLQNEESARGCDAKLPAKCPTSEGTYLIMLHGSS